MSSAFRNFIISLLIAGVIFGTVAVFAVGIIDDYVLNPETPEQAQETATPNSTQNGPSGLEGGGLDVNGKSFSILFLVSDYMPDVYDDYKATVGELEPAREKHAVSAVYCIFSKEKAEFVLTPVSVKTKLMIDGVAMTLERAYNYKSTDYIKGKIGELIGMGIDYCIDIDAMSFVDIYDYLVDYLGEFEYEVPRVIRYANTTEGFNVTIPKGNAKLNGKQAYALLRSDSYSNDTEKANTAADFTMNVLYALTSDTANRLSIRLIYTYIYNLCKSDMSANALNSNADLIFKMNDMKITFIAYPGTWEDGIFTPNTIDGKKLFSAYR